MLDYAARSSVSDLEGLLEKLNVSGVHICRLSQVKAALSKKYKSLIINLDNYGPGTHWVALDTKTRKYFDTYAEEMPEEIPRGYTRASTHKQLQDLTGTACGALCVLWLYYVRKSNGEATYYKFFKDVYPDF
jgi:hypothetical protein